VQGQAGKPFYHDRGPRLKFPDDPDTIVDNSCYCRYPYMRYFWIYAKVDWQMQQLKFFHESFPEAASSDIWYPSYRT
jgi:hypothetical protein